MSTSTTDTELGRRIGVNRQLAHAALEDASSRPGFSEARRAMYATIALAHFEAVKDLEKQRKALAEKEFFDNIYVHNPKPADA